MTPFTSNEGNLLITNRTILFLEIARAPRFLNDKDSLPGTRAGILEGGPILHLIVVQNSFGSSFPFPKRATFLRRLGTPARKLYRPRST